LSDAVSLQPQNATPLMRAVSQVNAERRPIAPGPIAAMWDPAKAPAAVLPYLAAAHGVSVWRSDWSDDRKRQVIAQTITLKRRRGTVPCFEGHLGFVDAELLQVISAPNFSVSRNAMTQAERQAWLTQFPELRVYYFSNRNRQLGVATPGVWRAQYWTVRASQAAVFSGQRAVIVDGGVERSAVVVASSGASDFARTVQVALPAPGRRLVLGPASAGFMTPLSSDASETLFTFRPGSGGPDTVRPGLQPVDVEPTHVALPQVGVAAVTAGQALAGPFRFLQNSRAREGVYDSIRLFDPARARAGKFRQRGGMVAGFSRLGQPAFHLELAVDLKFTRPKARRFPNLPGFVQAFDPTRTEEAMAAIRAAKLGRDKVEVRTNLYRRITAGDGVPLDGTRRLGQIIRSL
jgi:hypothetical protein